MGTGSGKYENVGKYQSVFIIMLNPI
eukprot:SAG25_NODE_10959_length_318_cov_0.721461_1_plen_25_part_10